MWFMQRNDRYMELIYIPIWLNSNDDRIAELQKEQRDLHSNMVKFK